MYNLSYKKCSTKNRLNLCFAALTVFRIKKYILFWGLKWMIYQSRCLSLRMQMAKSMCGDPRQTNTSTFLFSITKKAYLVQNRRTDMGTQCWVETNLHSFWPALRLSRNQPRIISLLKSCSVRSATYFTSLWPNVLRMYTFTHVLGYFLGLFCVC